MLAMALLLLLQQAPTWLTDTTAVDTSSVASAPPVDTTSSVRSGESNFGRYEGAFAGKWERHGEYMKLTRELNYVDPGGVVWRAPKGARVDGSSMPWILWAIVGQPFDADYGNASAVHDVACDSKDLRGWRATHRMYYLANRCSGVDETIAKIMFAAAWHFGPRWERREPPTPRFFQSTQEFGPLREYIEAHPEVTLESIESPGAILKTSR